MKYITLIITFTIMTSCMSINWSQPHQASVNKPPLIQVPFDAVDLNQDGNITKEEYLENASTLDVKTPGVTILGIMLGVGLLVGILIFLTTCYKGPSGIRKD
jgi:hypothetical protein